MACAVTNVLPSTLVSLAVWYVVATVRRHRRGIVAERGISVGADLASLADKPRMRVRSVSTVGPDRVRLVLTPETDRGDGLPTSSALDLLVFLREDELGFDLLQER